MNKTIHLTSALFCILLLIVLACGKGPDSASEAKEGGSCQGISATDGILACDGQKVIACSSYTQYKYIVTQTCPDNKKCVASPDGKKASCE